MSEFPANEAPLHPDFRIVGIGASAGGLEPLLRLFEAMPADSGMAFVIVLHLSPEHESNVATLLQRATSMPVLQVSDVVTIAPNHVYVIPPSKNLMMRDGELFLEPLTQQHGRATAIDVFFRTLADTHTRRSMGIVLSGTGSDGAVGIARIKEVGGVTIAQEPSDAQYDGMPRSAIGTGAIDMVLPIAQMPARMLNLAANHARIWLPEAEDLPTATQAEAGTHVLRDAEDALVAIMDLLRVRTGHDFQHYKQATVLRRIERRMQVNCVDTLGAYLSFLSEHHEETPLLLQDMLISVTNFFRDHEAFDALEQNIIPTIFSQSESGTPIRAWSAGCATGEEAYSLAMLLMQHADDLGGGADIQVFATDIDERAIHIGRRAAYPRSVATDVAPERLRQFFAEQDEHYQVRTALREKVLFASHNVLRDPPFSRVNLISCRNLLIYLNRDVQEKVLEMFHFALTPGGFLFLGSSESADIASRFFNPVDKRNRIYQASTIARSTHYVPPLPPLLVPAATPGYVAAEPRPRVPYADLHQRLLEHYAPPSVLANRDGEIVHLSEKAGRYLRYVAGEPSHGLIALVIPELRLELRTGLFQVAQNAVDVETRQVPVERDGQKYYVSLTIRPIRHDSIPGDFVLVLFNESENSSTAGQGGEAGTSFIARQLENELFMTKGQLQLTIEQYETSAEELKASNEELQAINEELRSATEELETSKEELQSINEELITVNHELKIKVDETSKSNDDLHNFIASTEIATIFVDRAMRIKRYTPRAGSIFKLIAGDIGRPLMDIAHSLDYKMLEQDADEVFQTLNTCEREVRGADGNWYIARLIPYRTNEDLISGLVLTFIDFTSLHLTQQKLAEEERRMRAVAASTREYAIIAMDREGRVSYWNSGAERIFGFQEAEMLGQDIAGIYTPQDNARGVAAAELDAARGEGRTLDERWYLRKDGSRIFCSSSTTRLDGDEITGFAKIVRDLGDGAAGEYRRDAESPSTALASRRASDEFLVGLSRELKHPLNLIQLNAELLLRIPEAQQTPRIAQVADTIRTAVLDQTRSIDSLLDLSSALAGKLALNKSLVDMAAITGEVVQSLSADIGAKQLALTSEMPGATLMVFADRARLKRSIWSLLANAIQFTDAHGGIALSLFERDGMCSLRIADTGAGIAHHLLPRLFTLDDRLGAPRVEGGGLGISLALAWQVARYHGGSVAAASEGPGKGASFTISLPAYETMAALAPPGRAEGDGELFAGRRLLVLDDNREHLQALADLLAACGASVTAAGSAGEALLQTQQGRFDLVVVNIATPTPADSGFIGQFRLQPEAARTPVIALTAGIEQAEVGALLAQGFSAHLRKPVSFDALVDAARALWGR
ncbi:chemotaxis protein CheB [Herbaspirillum sp. WKF16]|nr:chemotaxis protein CheB [Herbaspirillum sp. WKF16]WDZ98469.1 chemotaxis protein CheB [Herbaspirillum sp. WKF16]